MKSSIFPSYHMTSWVMQRAVWYRLDYKSLGVNMMNTFVFVLVLSSHKVKETKVWILFLARKSLPASYQLLIQMTCYTRLHQHRMYWSMFITFHLDLSPAENHELIIVLCTPDLAGLLSTQILRSQDTDCIHGFCDKWSSQWGNYLSRWWQLLCNFLYCCIFKLIYIIIFECRLIVCFLLYCSAIQKNL